MDQPAFLSSSTSTSGPEGALPPFREGIGQRAPAGELPAGDLPVTNTPSPFREGYSPEPGNPPLPRPGSDEGYPRR